MLTKNQTTFAIYSIPAFILLIPLIAMQFTTEVNWTLSDFVIMGGLLFMTSFSIDFVLKKFKSLKSRLTLVFGILLVFILVWAELAVGIFGSPIAGS